MSANMGWMTPAAIDAMKPMKRRGHSGLCSAQTRARDTLGSSLASSIMSSSAFLPLPSSFPSSASMLATLCAASTDRDFSLSTSDAPASPCCSACASDWTWYIALYMPASLPPISSACVPRSTTLPLSMTTIRSAPVTVLRRCAIMMVVTPVPSAPPSPSSRSRLACTILSLSVSRALVASSRRSTLGCLMMLLAMHTRCRCPPDS
mmetsp:Transcript_5829/g.14066  ORF Transcript_5829/g.14066 Transcript_5829/m.14066 type:complete len:206 (-) Transcript_5829:656-1273(-)